MKVKNIKSQVHHYHGVAVWIVYNSSMHPFHRGAEIPAFVKTDNRLAISCLYFISQLTAEAHVYRSAFVCYRGTYNLSGRFVSVPCSFHASPAPHGMPMRRSCRLHWSGVTGCAWHACRHPCMSLLVVWIHHTFKPHLIELLCAVLTFMHAASFSLFWGCTSYLTAIDSLIVVHDCYIINIVTLYLVCTCRTSHVSSSFRVCVCVF
jgi:hypothetical protein